MTDQTYNDESHHTPESRDRDARLVGHEPKGETMTDDPKCEPGCISYYGGEKKHHRDCPYYPESLTKLNTDRIETLLAERDALEAEAEGSAAIIAAERAEVLKLRQENERLREDLKNAAEVMAVYCDPMNMEPEHEMFSTIIINRALTPSAPAPVVPKMKPLLWVYHPAGMVASNDMGGSYIIDTRGPRPKWLKWPGGHGPDLETVMGMQVAAQADHEARILPQLDMATVTVTEEG